MSKVFKNISLIKRAFCLLVACMIFSGCGESGGSNGGGSASLSKPSDPEVKRATITDPAVTDAPGESTFSGNNVTLDYSNTQEGYVVISYSGGSEKLQVQITNPNGEMYPYPLGLGGPKAFPLTGGNGTYTISVLENVQADLYSMALSETVDVSVADEFKPYIYPNQYVDFTKASNVVAKAIELSNASSTDLDFLTKVYEYTISTITYDTEFAANAPVNYIPNPDNTLSSGKGICFDYSSVMSSMLRCQGIPTKLVVGYSGTAYHAWISVFLKEEGWVENIIQFDGTSWSLMDPTLAASNDPGAVGKYIGDGSNYTAKYYY